MSRVKTRFAPSPTGYLHIGGARTALFNYLYARRHGGVFVLRIEDTDRERSTEESTQAILDSMEWLGFACDEGPYFQSKRGDIYKAHVEKLLAEEKAYLCDCPPELLDAKRKRAMLEGRNPMYDGTCRSRTDVDPEKPHVIRFKSQKSGQTVVNDLLRGPVVFDNAELDDLVLVRTDGGPTYNFTVVVDDAHMGITHVIRGDDHLNNTPRQIQLYEAMGYEVPQMAHVPMILGQDKKRLSKRHGATSVGTYKEEGYLPEALANFLVRLGWSHGDQEIFSMEELVSLFDLDEVGRSAGVFNQEKLLWLNSQYIQECPVEKLAELSKPFLKAKGFDCSDSEKLALFVESFKPRVKTLVEMADRATPYYKREIEMEPKAAKKLLKEENAPIINALREAFSFLSSWTVPELEKAFESIVQDKLGLNMGQGAQPLRIAATGSSASPGLFETLVLVGREWCLERLAKALDEIDALHSNRA